ncbi:MAG: hypothetical protein IPM29_07200 [Planctomycetes bacterium]|nr:hypothetical protein [Planctomycetota bacterium]
MRHPSLRGRQLIAQADCGGRAVPRQIGDLVEPHDEMATWPINGRMRPDAAAACASLAAAPDDRRLAHTDADGASRIALQRGARYTVWAGSADAASALRQGVMAGEFVELRPIRGGARGVAPRPRTGCAVATTPARATPACRWFATACYSPTTMRT